jgi:hypothetical protein
MNAPKRSAPGREIAGAAKLRLVQSYQFCPHTATRTERMPQAHPHYAREVCTRCGAFIRWLPSPESIERRKMNMFRIAKLLASNYLDAWQRQVVESVSRLRGELSPRQEECLGRIYRRYFSEVAPL